MAQRVLHDTVDDLDGVSPAEERTFVLGYTKFSIDLNDEHAKMLDEALAGLEPFLAVARAEGPKKPKSGPSMAAYGLTRDDMRVYCQRHGMPYGRGRYNRVQLAEAKQEKAAGLL